MKKIDLIRIGFWWFFEKKSGELWYLWSKNRTSYWFDLIPAFFYRKRKEAERYFINKYKENIYGQKL